MTSLLEVVLLGVLWSLAALAQDIPLDEDEIDIPSKPQPKEDDEWGFAQKKEKLTLSMDEDESMHDFLADAKKKAPPPVHFHLDLNGKKPLADNFDIQVAAFNEHYLAIELPVLVATDKASFAAQHPGGLVLVAEVWAENVHQVLTEVITAERVLDASPTLVFFKTALPVAARQANLRFLVKSSALPAPPPPAPPSSKGAKTPPPPAAPPPPKELFARSTVFTRP